MNQPVGFKDKEEAVSQCIQAASSNWKQEEH